MRQANVYVNNVMAGILTETDEGKYLFRYDDAFLADDGQSIVPKMCERVYVGDVVSLLLQHAFGGCE